MNFIDRLRGLVYRKAIREAKERHPAGTALHPIEMAPPEAVDLFKRDPEAYRRRYFNV